MQKKIEKLLSDVLQETKPEGGWNASVLQIPIPSKPVKFFHCLDTPTLEELTEKFNRTKYKRDWHPKRYRDELVTFLNRQFPHKVAFGSQVEYGLYIKSNGKTEK